jgi:RNA polymerase sigma-70 factor (ECF subfamily)
MSLSPRVRAAKRTSGRGYRNRWIPARIRSWEQNGAEALEFAVLLLREKLSPAERAAYVLREAFDYPYRQVAEILQPRGSEHSPIGHPSSASYFRGAPRAVSSTEQRCLVETFIAAAEKRDMLVDNPVQKHNTLVSTL